MGGHSRRVAVESVNTRQARTQQQSYLTSLLQRLRFYLLQLPPDFHRATAAFDWLCDLEISTVRDAARRTTPCYRKRTDMALRASYTPLGGTAWLPSNLTPSSRPSYTSLPSTVPPPTTGKLYSLLEQQYQYMQRGRGDSHACSRTAHRRIYSNMVPVSTVCTSM